MNKKGFTLVEILVTIGLLALLGVGIGVSLNNVLKNQEENTYEAFIEKIKSSTLLYSSNSAQIVNDLEFNNGYILISMNDLINGGYIRENVKNPNTNETLKELSINEKGEDYSQARVYYSVDKEMIIEYPFIKPEEDVYLNVINYTTLYKSNEDELCYKGLNTSSLGLTLVESGGLLSKDLVAGNSIIAYMEDGSKCTDDILNSNKIGAYKIKYIFDYDDKKGSADRIITVKAPKPEISNLKTVLDTKNNHNVTISATIIDKSEKDLKYCINYTNNSEIGDCKTWKDLSLSDTNRYSFSVKIAEISDANKGSALSKVPIYLFVKNVFEEYVRVKSNVYIQFKFNVRFDEQGGTSCSTKVLLYGDEYGTLCTPTRTGYTFNGWYTGTNGSGQKIASTDRAYLTSDQTLYAKWTSNKYTLTYDNQSGSGCTSKTVTYDSTYGTLCTPSRTGYTFAGWYTGTDGTGTNITSSTTVKTASDHTVYAKWQPDTYTLYYDNQGGSGCTSKAVTYDSTYGTLCTPTKKNYTFRGWYTGTNGTGTNITSSTIVKITSNQTVYAKWELTSSTLIIHLDTINQTFYNNVNKSKTLNSTYVIENIEPYTTISAALNNNSDYKRPITNSYYFTDWTDVYGSSISLSTQLAGTLDIYAKWAADTTNPECVINVSSSGLTGTSSDAESGVASTSWTNGTSLSLTTHSYTVIDYALNTKTCNVKIKKMLSYEEIESKTCYDSYEECTTEATGAVFLGRGPYDTYECKQTYGPNAWYTSKGYNGEGCYKNKYSEVCKWHDYSYDCSESVTVYYCESGYNEISGTSKCYKKS